MLASSPVHLALCKSLVVIGGRREEVFLVPGIIKLLNGA
ncbi:hypothetical protein MGWOODY_Smn1806 [hydrothermal vent metagenome]|jgi:hypothetical protein|uniref:Uncharacterized protein n=1 Tax=hydrothermal vent metagenome TaxID=652676 RepID=A0A160TK03_9ZZZZ